MGDIAKAAVQTFAVPSSLAELDQWGLWRPELVGQRTTKVPYSAIDGRKASSTDPARWVSFDAAAAAWARAPQRYAGLAFVFLRGQGLVGVDLDDCLDMAGLPKDWASGIIERFSDTYMETSPSEQGIKIWARGEIPANVPGVKVADGSIEMYDHGRYFTVTAKAFRGAPLQVEDHAADLLRLYEYLVRPRKVKDWPLQPLAGGRIPHGQQHSTLVSIAGTLRARRVCDEAVLACLQAVNVHQCEQPGSPEAIARIVRSTRLWGAR